VRRIGDQPGQPRDWDKLAEKLAIGGFTPQEVHEYLAKQETDGVVSPKKLAQLKALLENDGYLVADHGVGTNFVDESGAVLKRYVEYHEKVNAGSEATRPPPLRGELGVRSLFGNGRDVRSGLYMKLVKTLSGENTAVWGQKGQRHSTIFTDLYAASPDNQLNLARDWLGWRYHKMGYRDGRTLTEAEKLRIPHYEFQPVEYNGKTTYNVVVTLPGDEALKWVIIDAHYDTADYDVNDVEPANIIQLSRDHKLSAAQIKWLYDRLKPGQASRGADDNHSSNAAALEIGRLYMQQWQSGVRFKNTLKIVHSTMEELPPDGSPPGYDCAGAQRFIDDLLARGVTVLGAYVLDMIAVDRTESRRTQLSVGENPQSDVAAVYFEQAARDLNLGIHCEYRGDGARKNWVEQTNAARYKLAGLPVVVVHESSMNDDNGRMRVGYHDPGDHWWLIDEDYAVDNTRATGEGAFRLAEPYRPAEHSPS
jgi:hypothetical protein